jgi:hypothetical protein
MYVRDMCDGLDSTWDETEERKYRYHAMRD